MIRLLLDVNRNLRKGVVMKRLVLGVAAIVAAVFLAPATAGAASVHGVVVARSHGTMLVATRNGNVVAVKGHAPMGARVVGSTVVGHAKHARIHGVIVATKGSTEFVASNRHLVAIKTGGSTTGSGSPSGNAPGTIVTSSVTIHSNGTLGEDSQDDQGEDSSQTIAVQATVTAVGTGTVTVSVNGQSITLDLPAGLTLPQSLVGQTVTINVDLSNGDDQGDDSGGSGSGD